MSAARHGTYHYWKDGIRQPVHEPWSLRPTTTGSHLQGERWVADRLVLSVEADFHAGRCEGFEVTFHRSAGDPPLNASYRLQGTSLEWSRGDTNAPDTFARGELPFGPRDHLFPLLRAATGMLIERLAGNPGTVIVPWLRDPRQAEHLLLPLPSQRSATPLETDEGTGRRYRYCGGEYGGDGAECWLDGAGLLLRYCWSAADGQWEVRLADDDSA